MTGPLGTQQGGAGAYLAQAIATASPLKIVRMLYDKATAQLDLARQEMAGSPGRRSARGAEAASRAMAILSELRSSLDLETGGGLAAELDRLYDFILQRTSQANLAWDPAPLEEGLAVLRTLKEGWDGIPDA